MKESKEMMKNHLLAAGLALAASALGAAPLSVSVGADHTNNVYAVGEPIAFTVSAKEADGRLAATGSVEVLVDNFGTKPLVNRHRVDLATGNPFTVNARIDEPGFVRLTVKVPGTNDVLWGVGVEPERIRQGGTRPDDFEAFWR